MQRAGEAAAAEIERAYPASPRRDGQGVRRARATTAATGGWSRARSRAAARVCSCVEAGEPRSEESKAARALALPIVTQGESPDARL